MGIQEIYKEVIEKLKKDAPKIGASFPHAGNDGKWDNKGEANITWWTNGFWPGIMWQMYDITGEEIFRSIAQECENKLDKAFENIKNLHHDVGFMWGDSAVASYTITRSEKSASRALHAAFLLAGRFNLKWGAMASWNGDTICKSIIDNMMNLRLLFWAAKETGDMRFKHIAIAHADKMMTTLIRPDGTSHHLCEFNSETGEFVQYLKGQGYSPDSQWSRGQAWAIYGYTRMYENTGDEKYLNAAKKCADNFIEKCGGKTPAWDFCAPIDEEEGFISDTSAGACAASGIITMAKYLPDRNKYEDAAKSILVDMYENHKSDGEMLLIGGTGHKPLNRDINVALIYGDFYFLEALRKLCDENYRNIYA